MEHNRTLALGENRDIFAYNTVNSNTLTMHKLVGDVMTNITPSYTIDSIGSDMYKCNVDMPNEECIVLCVLQDAGIVLRVGNPTTRFVYYTGNTGESTSYERVTTAGGAIESGTLTEYGSGLYGVVPSDVSYSIMMVGNGRWTVDVPYNEICIESGEGADGNFINVGYNMFGFSGVKNSYHNGTVWVNDAGRTAKASDLAKAVAAKYGLVWSDQADPLWIGHYVKYIRTYVENDGQFKMYSPSITPESNDNNFELMQVDEKSNEYIRGVSILLLQELETGGATVPFKEV